MQYPPYTIQRVVETALPGIWREFVRRGNAGLRGGRGQVTSWWRSPAHNRRVGGLPDSQHILGTAFDYAGSDAPRVAAQLRREGFIVDLRSSHLHAQALPAGMARRVGVFDALGVFFDALGF